MKSKDSKRVKRTQRDYSLDFKLVLVSGVKKDNYANKQVQKIYAIHG